MADEEGELPVAGILPMLEQLVGSKAAKKRSKDSPSNRELESSNKRKKVRQDYLKVCMMKRRSLCGVVQTETHSQYAFASIAQSKAAIKPVQLGAYLKDFFGEDGAQFLYSMIDRQMQYIAGVKPNTVTMANFLHRVIFDYLQERCTQLKVTFTVGINDPNQGIRSVANVLALDQGKNIPEYLEDHRLVNVGRIRKIRNRPGGGGGGHGQVAISDAIDDESGVDDSNLISYYCDLASFGKAKFDIIEKRFATAMRIQRLRPFNEMALPVILIPSEVVFASLDKSIKAEKVEEIARDARTEYGNLHLRPVGDDASAISTENFAFRHDYVAMDDGLSNIILDLARVTDECVRLKEIVQGEKKAVDFDIDYIAEELLGPPNPERYWDAHHGDKDVTETQKEVLSTLDNNRDMSEHFIAAGPQKIQYHDGGMMKTAEVVVKGQCPLPDNEEDEALAEQERMKAERNAPVNLKWKAVASGIYAGIRDAMASAGMAAAPFMPGDGSGKPELDNFMSVLLQQQLLRFIIDEVVNAHLGQSAKHSLGIKLEKETKRSYVFHQ